MKKLKVTYFKPGSGKYYTEENIEISEGMDFWELVDALRKPGVLRLNGEMAAVVTDSDDNKQPYFVPHYFPARAERGQKAVNCAIYHFCKGCKEWDKCGGETVIACVGGNGE